jgi:8-oxo-dGTP diphosphatase
MLQVFLEKPAGFNERVQVGASYVECEGKILLLKISAHKSEGGFWGVPAGKMEAGETPFQTAKRELSEETSIEALEMKSLGPLYMRKPHIDYVYHLFHVKFAGRPKVLLSKEHVDFAWVDLKEIESLPLMVGAKEGLDRFLSWFQNT